MNCPICNGQMIGKYTANDTDKVYRKRQCVKCRYVIYTTEQELPTSYEDLKNADRVYRSKYMREYRKRG